MPPPRLKLGLDTYTVRGSRWNAIQLLDYAARHGLDAIQLGSSSLESSDGAYFKRVKEHAASLGISIDAAIGCICRTSSYWKSELTPAQYLLDGLRMTQGLGSTNLHVFMGGFAERRGFEGHVEETIKSLRSVRAQFIDANIKIAVENHGDFQAWELKALVEQAGRDFVGVCLDSGNSVTVMEDPLLTLETLGPYTVTTHIRDAVVYAHPRGAAYQWVALGDGSIDFQTFFNRFAELCPQSAVQLEILTGMPPRVLPYLEPEYWTNYPKGRAAEFARFEALAKKGRPFEGTMLIAPRGTSPPPEYEAAINTQQRFDVERSFVYAKQKLGIGIRGRTE